MNKYAVLIGNSQFPDETNKDKLPDLACPVLDVDGLSNVLASERGEFEVLSLKNKPSYQVLQELQRTVNKAQADDLLLFYYSGHGKPNKAGILYLTTFDTVIAELESTAILINRVYDIFGTGKAKKIVIILDCCYSGAAGQGFKGAVDDQLQQLNNARGTYLVTASTELQVAHESAAEGLSLFTKHLIAGLETGEADKDGDGWVSMNELYDYVQSHVVAENPAQQPTKHVKEERGGLFIAKSGRNSKISIENIEDSFGENNLKRGTVLKDYVIGSVLGVGGLGVTYLAKHKKTQMLVAIKEYKLNLLNMSYNAADRIECTVCINIENYSFAEIINIFLKNVQSISNFNHPNILNVIDFFNTNSTAYIVTEYINGINLKQYLSKKGRLMPEELDVLVESMLNATEKIHASGYLHRDITPKNILIDSKGKFILSDFDAVCINPNYNKSIFYDIDIPVLVCDGYSPSEQYTNSKEKIGEWSDIYSLAATFYTCISGKQPVSAIERVESDDLKSIFKFSNSNYSSKILSMIDWGLKLNIGDRPKSISEWRNSKPPKTIFNWLNSGIFKMK